MVDVSTAASFLRPTDPVSAWEEWKAERHARVTAPQGELALIQTTWLPDGELPDAAAALAGRPASVTYTELTRSNIDTGEPEHGYRLWDALSDGPRTFAGVPTFDYDPAWVIAAHFTPVSAERTIPYEHIRDAGGTRDLAVPGDITATIAGAEYTLSAFDDDGTLLLVFGDPTNGSDDESDRTYASGRFLFVQRPEGSDFGSEADVVLDFNRAFVPPCGYSDQYNCPLPPAQNRLTVPVRAGERFVLHAN